MLLSLNLNPKPPGDRRFVYVDEIADEQWQFLREHTANGICAFRALSVTSPFACSLCKRYVAIRAEMMKVFD